MLEMINLQKGDRLELTKGTSITVIKAALGWDAETAPGKPTCDLDASVFCRDANDKILSKTDILYFGSPKDTNKKPHIYSGALLHSGDDLTGSSPGDDETITFDLAKIPANVVRASIVINIYDAVNKGQKFGLVKNAFVRIDDAAGNVLGKYDLTEDYSRFTAIHVGDVYRHNNEWKFSAVGEGKMHGDLNGFLTEWS